MAREYFTVATFRASSGQKWWRVCKDEKGGLSCTCPGWCRRVAKDGTRSCKHVRKVRERGVDNLSVVPARATRTKPAKLGLRRFRL